MSKQNFALLVSYYYETYLTESPQKTFLLENLIVVEVVKMSAFLDSRHSLLCPHYPGTVFCPEQDESGSHLNALLL
jgi:hypothetical protein